MLTGNRCSQRTHLDFADGILGHHQSTCREFHQVISHSRPNQQSSHSPAVVLSVCQPATWQTIVLIRLQGMTWINYCQLAATKSRQTDEISATKWHATGSKVKLLLY